jgi:hypothetical protein
VVLGADTPDVDGFLTALESQTLGFREHIQLVVATALDSCEPWPVIAQWRDRYADNVVVLTGLGADTSAARNQALGVATGEFVAFANPDDEYEPTSLETCVTALRDTPTAVGACLRLRWFGDSHRRHNLDHMFGRTRVVDISKRGLFIQAYVPSIVFRRDPFSATTFVEGSGELADTRFILERVEEHGGQLVFLSEAGYRRRFRKSEAADSITGRRWTDLMSDAAAEFWAWLGAQAAPGSKYRDYARTLLLWWLNEFAFARNVLDLPLGDRYEASSRAIQVALSLVDDAQILSNRYLSAPKRAVLLDAKHGRGWRADASLDDRGSVSWAGTQLVVLPDQVMEVTTINLTEGGACEIDVAVPLPDPRSFGIALRVGGDVAGPGGPAPLTCSEVHLPYRDTYFLGRAVEEAIGLRITVPPEVAGQVVVECRRGGDLEAQLGASGLESSPTLAPWDAPLTFADTTNVTRFEKPIKDFLEEADGDGPDLAVRRFYRSSAPDYRIMGNAIVTAHPKAIEFTAFSLERALAEEAITLMCNLHAQAAIDRLSGAEPSPASTARFVEAFRIRTRYLTSDRTRDDEKTVIVADSSRGGNNNGEVLYRHLLTHIVPQRPDYRIYYRIRQNSLGPDAATLGYQVLETGSPDEPELFLKAAAIVASFPHQVYREPVNHPDLYRNLMDFRFVFLGHGILPVDYSVYYRKERLNAHYYITSSGQERDSLLAPRYGYRESEVKLLGNPRLDLLGDRPAERMILIAPTWRRYLSKNRLASEADSFADSDFCRFYNRLLNDPALLAKLEQSDYRVVLALHPIMKPEAANFRFTSSRIALSDSRYNNNHLVSLASIMLTDYSSILFDFAYLRRPAIYNHFDADIYYRLHADPGGTFDVARDGFGIVARTYDEVVAGLLATIDAPVMAEEHRARADQFFAFADRNNCARVGAEVVRICDSRMPRAA